MSIAKRASGEILVRLSILAVLLVYSIATCPQIAAAGCDDLLNSLSQKTLTEADIPSLVEVAVSQTAAYLKDGSERSILTFKFDAKPTAGKVAQQLADRFDGLFPQAYEIVEFGDLLSRNWPGLRRPVFGFALSDQTLTIFRGNLASHVVIDPHKGSLVNWGSNIPQNPKKLLLFLGDAEQRPQIVELWTTTDHPLYGGFYFPR